MRKYVYFMLVMVFMVHSCDDIIDLQDITSDTVTILAPTDTITLSETNVTFSWNSLEGAESYNLQIATPDFESASEIVLDSTVTTTAFTQSLSSGIYQWRIRAENANYQTAYSTLNLTIDESDPIDISSEQIVLLAPADATIFTTTDTLNFSWDAIINADNYVIQIATPSFAAATAIIENETLSTTSFSISNLAVQDYEWRVKATNTNSETLYATQSFSVE